MTLLVGVLCAGGVVIGADSGTTYGAFGQQTVMMAAPKVEVVRSPALIAVSGPVGLGQRLTGEFERVHRGGALKGAPHEVMTTLREIFWKPIKYELEVANVASGAVGRPIANLSALSTTLLAMVVGGVPHLFSFDQQAAPEEIVAKLPVVSAGSGQHNADPFLAFLKGVYWEEGRAPSLAEGIFTALWTLEQCILVEPANVAGPARIFTLAMDNGKPDARQVPDGELEDHRLAIAAAKDALRAARHETKAPAPPMPK